LLNYRNNMRCKQMHFFDIPRHRPIHKLCLYAKLRLVRGFFRHGS
jgi:hypothetical protein